MTINANSKIGAIIKGNAPALEAIISVSHNFEKLRNPLLRKLMAGRTSLSMAARIGGCNLNDIFQKLEPLGFQIDRSLPETEINKSRPEFANNQSKQTLSELDVRPVISAGGDPLNMIMEKVSAIKPGHTLRIINSFEPAPLISLLEKRGFKTYVDKINHNQYDTYFFRDTVIIPEAIEHEERGSDWESVMHRFYGKLLVTDVRQLPMPQPMHTILKALENLPVGMALHVLHKRIPVFLLPELKDREFEYRIKEIKEGEVELLIYKDK